MELIVAGAPNKVIAGELGTSLRTVETRRQGVFGKLGVKTVADLVRAALTAEEGTYTTVQLGDLISQFIEDPVKRTPGAIANAIVAMMPGTTPMPNRMIAGMR